jgi:hypothetical protein
MTATDGGAAGNVLVRGLRWPGRITWRWLTGKHLDGVPRTDATFLARGTAALDRDKAPRPPDSLIAEIRGDIAAVREELELRRTARRVTRATGEEQRNR